MNEYERDCKNFKLLALMVESRALDVSEFISSSQQDVIFDLLRWLYQKYEGAVSMAAWKAKEGADEQH